MIVITGYHPVSYEYTPSWQRQARAFPFPWALYPLHPREDKIRLPPSPQTRHPRHSPVGQFKCFDQYGGGGGVRLRLWSTVAEDGIPSDSATAAFGSGENDQPPTTGDTSSHPFGFRRYGATMIQRPISTMDIDEGQETVKLEVMREDRQYGDWHNRYVRNASTKVHLSRLPTDPPHRKSCTTAVECPLSTITIRS